MASNYSLTIGSKFKPFSYLELIAPVQLATEAHYKLEEAYGELAMLANAWKLAAMSENNPKAATMYMQYYNDLLAQVDDLNKIGLTPSSNKGMLRMKARYAGEILPIKLAYEKREALAKEQRDIIKNDPTRIFLRYVSDMSLDDLIDNPNLDYGEQISGAQLQALSSHMSKNLSEKLFDKNSKWSKSKLRFLYEREIKQGASPQSIFRAIAKQAQTDDEAAMLLLEIGLDIYNLSGIDNWTEEGDWRRDKVWGYIQAGYYDAIGKDKSDIVKDDWGMTVAKHNLENPNPPTPMPQRELNPVPLRARHEIEKEMTSFNKYVLDSGMMEKDPITGRLKFTNKGKAMFRPTAVMKSSVSTPSPTGPGIGSLAALNNAKKGTGATLKYEDLPKEVRNINALHVYNSILKDLFGDSVDSIYDNATKDGWAAMETAINNYYIDNVEKGYDTERSTGFKYTLDESDQLPAFKTIAAEYKDGEIPIVEYTGSKNGYVDTEEKLGKAGTGGWRVVNTISTGVTGETGKGYPIVATVETQDSDGKTKTAQIAVPRTMNPTVYGNAAGYHRTANANRKKVNLINKDIQKLYVRNGIRNLYVNESSAQYLEYLRSALEALPKNELDKLNEYLEAIMVYLSMAHQYEQAGDITQSELWRYNKVQPTNR